MTLSMTISMTMTLTMMPLLSLAERRDRVACYLLRSRCFWVVNLKAKDTSIRLSAAVSCRRPVVNIVWTSVSQLLGWVSIAISTTLERLTFDLAATPAVPPIVLTSTLSLRLSVSSVFMPLNVFYFSPNVFLVLSFCHASIRQMDGINCGCSIVLGSEEAPPHIYIIVPVSTSR